MDTRPYYNKAANAFYANFKKGDLCGNSFDDMNYPFLLKSSFDINLSFALYFGTDHSDEQLYFFRDTNRFNNRNNGCYFSNRGLFYFSTPKEAGHIEWGTITKIDNDQQNKTLNIYYKERTTPLNKVQLLSLPYRFLTKSVEFADNWVKMVTVPLICYFNEIGRCLYENKDVDAVISSIVSPNPKLIKTQSVSVPEENFSIDLSGSENIPSRASSSKPDNKQPEKSGVSFSTLLKVAGGVLAAGLAVKGVKEIASSINEKVQSIQSKPCPLCQGQGKVMSSPMFYTTCPICAGQGRVSPDDYSGAQARASQYSQMVIGSLLFGKSGTSSSSPSQSGTTTQRSKCPRCNGTGKCPNCAGRGQKEYKNGYSVGTFYSDCPDCHGTGRCRYCGGSGKGLY